MQHHKSTFQSLCEISHVCKFINDFSELSYYRYQCLQNSYNPNSDSEIRLHKLYRNIVESLPYTLTTDKSPSLGENIKYIVE